MLHWAIHKKTGAGENKQNSKKIDFYFVVVVAIIQ